MINDLLEWLMPRAPRGTDILQAQNIGRICFRGDTRPPDEIFQSGFSPRRSTGVVFRDSKADIDPESAACVTPRFLMAAFFPGYEGNGPNNQAQARETYVYALYLTTGYNTHQIQAQRAASDQGQPNNAAFNLYAHELSTDAVPASCIIGTVKCVRHWTPSRRWLDDNANHRVFVEDSTSINLNFDDNLPERQHCAEVAMEFLRDISGRLHNFPTSGSGYHANDPRSLDGV